MMLFALALSVPHKFLLRHQHTLAVVIFGAVVAFDVVGVVGVVGVVAKRH